MKKFWILWIILGESFSLFAQHGCTPVEKLVYIGYYNWGMLWVKAGWVEFTLSESDKYPEANKLEAVGGTLPSWDWVFTIRDTLVSHYDRCTFLPYEFSRRAHEGNYHKVFDYKFDYRDSVVWGNVNRVGKYRRQDTVALEPNTYDMLSVAWMARSLDFEQYKKDDRIPIRILIDSRVYDLYVRYLGLEKVKISGKKRECYVFSPLLLDGDVFKGGENMKVWVSKDDYRLPLMVEAKILVGSVKAVLYSAERKKPVS